jgi:hypothetical protein
VAEVAEANKMAVEDMETAKIDSLTIMQTKIKNYAKSRREELLNDASKLLLRKNTTERGVALITNSMNRTNCIFPRVSVISPFCDFSPLLVPPCTIACSQAIV